MNSEYTKDILAVISSRQDCFQSFHRNSYRKI